MSIQWCLVVLCAIVTVALAKPAEIQIVKREVAGDGASGVAVVAFPGATDGQEDAILSEAEEGSNLEREQRSPEADFGDYDDVDDDDDDGPEGRHLKLKHKHKFKPHKHHHGFLGGHGGFLGGHGHGHGHGHKPLLGGHGCRKLHGCGGYGGWQQPHYGGYGPIAAAFAGPSSGYGPWRPGSYGGYGPTAQSHIASYNLGPFQATFGLAQAG